MALFGTEGGHSVLLLKLPSEIYSKVKGTAVSHLNADDVYNEIVSGNLGKSLQISNEILESVPETIGGVEALGRTKGYLSGIVNSLSAGRLNLEIAIALRKLTKTDQGAAILFLVLDIMFTVFLWIFLRNVYSAIVRRLFLEARLYDRIAPSDALHFAAVRRWIKASWTMFVKSLFFYLWCFTVVGGFIKYYSYYAVPYIVAENPDINTLDAIRLSREIMNGHKKEAFLFDLSYIGWFLLSIVTVGVSDLVYGLPYRIAGRTEYYTKLREAAKENGIANAERLDDTYLYEKGDRILLYETYFDVVDRQTYVHENQITLHPVRAFFSKWLGLWVGSLEKKKKYEELEGIKYQMYYDERRRDGRAYPARLNPRWRQSRFKLKPINFLRSYSIWTLLLLFLLFAFIGWSWEVGLQFSAGNGFVNRGVLHGPWLPIYGVGGVVALMLCSRFRKHPVKEFIFSVILCGVLEYLGSYYLETVYHQKWWSYDGHFLNLHGRICAEGLFVFGIACMLVVYLVAPVFDYLISKLKKQILIFLAVGLFAVFAADLAYSSKHPNMVKGAIVEEDGEG